MRYILFSWNNPKLIESIVCFLDCLPKDDDSLVVTTGIDGVANFLSAGYRSISLSQIKPTSTKYIFDNFTEKQLRSFSELDRKIGKTKIKGIPNISNDYYTNLSAYYLSKFFDTIQLVNPEIIFVWNGLNPAQKALSILSEHFEIPCYYMERGLMPNTLCVDNSGVNFASHIAGNGWNPEKIPIPSDSDLKLLEQDFATLHKNQDTVVKTGKKLSTKQIKEQLSIPKTARIILFALQIERDSNIVFYSPHYKSMKKIIKDILCAMENIEEVFLIIKPHPENFDDKKSIIGLDTKNAILSEDISLHSLIDIANVVICVNSTVGLEALTQKKQVIVLGNAIYSHKKFTKDLNDKTTLSDLIKQALSDSENKKFNSAEFNRFIVYLKKHCLFNLDPQDPWHSRENIPAQIEKTAKKTTKKLSFHNKILEKTVSFNQKIMKKLRKKRSILIHSKNRFEFLRKNGHNVVVAKNKLSLFFKLLKRYDLVIIDGFMGKRLKFLDRLFRKTLFLTKNHRE